MLFTEEEGMEHKVVIVRHNRRQNANAVLEETASTMEVGTKDLRLPQRSNRKRQGEVRAGLCCVR